MRRDVMVNEVNESNFIVLAFEKTQFPDCTIFFKVLVDMVF